MAIELEEATEVKNEKVEENTNGQKVVRTRLTNSRYGISVLDIGVNNLEDGHYSGLDNEIVNCLDVIDEITEPFITFNDAMGKLTDQVHDSEIDDKYLDQIKYAFCELAGEPIVIARKDPAVSILHEKIESINGVISTIEFLKDNINKNKNKQVITRLADVAKSLGIKNGEDNAKLMREVDSILQKYGLIKLDSGMVKDTEEITIVIGFKNMEVDRIKLSGVIDRLIGIVGYEESGEDRDYYMTPEVRKALSGAINEVISLHENWQEFL